MAVWHGGSFSASLHCIVIVAILSGCRPPWPFSRVNWKVVNVVCTKIHRLGHQLLKSWSRGVRSNQGDFRRIQTEIARPRRLMPLVDDKYKLADTGICTFPADAPVQISVVWLLYSQKGKRRFKKVTSELCAAILQQIGLNNILCYPWVHEKRSKVHQGYLRYLYTST